MVGEKVVDVHKPLKVRAVARVHVQVWLQGDHKVADREVHRPRAGEDSSKHVQPEDQERGPEAEQHGVGQAEEGKEWHVKR